MLPTLERFGAPAEEPHVGVLTRVTRRVGVDNARSTDSSWRVHAARGRVIDMSRPSERPRLLRHPLAWLRTRDRDLAVLRRAGRAAIVMPAMFALGDKVLANPAIATFAAFGSFALLLLVDFPGRIVDRLQSQLLLCVSGAALITLATVASQTSWSAALAMAAVAFGVLFAGVVSSVLAGAGPALLLAFVLPVATRAPLGQIPDRLAG
jgi:hypothetical protein